MGRAKSAAEAIRLGCERSSKKDSNIVNDDILFKKLQPAVERTYQKRMDQWLEYVYTLRLSDSWLTSVNRWQRTKTPEPSPYDLKSLKDFVRNVAYGIDGEEGIDVPGSETVRKYWNTFTAAFQRANLGTPLPSGIARAVTEVCTLFSIVHLFI